MSSSREFRERLIDEVKRFPVLYDTRHEHHRDVDFRDRCWAEIAAKLDNNSEVLKREWKILRDSLRQSLKKSHLSGVPPRKMWRFQSRMSFLLPHMTKRPTRASVRHEVKLSPQPAVPETEIEDCNTWPTEGHATTSELDSLELFFASVCASARSLPTPQRRELKRRVLDALLRCEAAAEETQAHQPSSSIRDEFKTDAPLC